jgi:hypothetical protein
MKKKYTDSDIQKLLTDLAELVPEIDPNDAEWREFLREFIAARPNVHLDEALAKEVRQKLFQRVSELKNPKGFILPLWLKLSGTFLAGAAACALIIVPMIRTPEFSQTQDELAPVANMKTDRMRGSSGEPEIALLTMEDAETIPEFEIEPMMAKEMGFPKTLRSLSSEEDGEMVAASGTLNSEVGMAPVMMDMDGAPMMERNSERDLVMPVVPVQLKWEDVPSDDQIFRVAVEVFENNNFDTLGLQKPFIDKWWERGEENIHTEFAPEVMSVVFVYDDGKELRMEINVITMEVVRLIWRGQ